MSTAPVSATYVNHYRPGLLKASARLIDDLRIERGMTEEQLAAAAHLDLEVIQDTVDGKRVPGLGAVMQLASALGVNPATLAADIINASRGGQS